MIQIALQDLHRRHLINDFLSFFSGYISLQKDTVRCDRRQPLIPKNDLDAKRFQLLLESDGDLPANADVPVHVPGKAQHDLGGMLLPDQ